MLLTLLTVACLVIFGDSHVFPIRMGILAFAVLPFVIWGAIGFGVGGATLTVFWTAALATVLTALGSDPSQETRRSSTRCSSTFSSSCCR